MNERRKRIIYYVLGAIFIGFVLLALTVSFLPLSLIDRQFSLEIQEHQHPAIDVLMKAISWPGTAPQSIFMVVATSLIFLFFKRKREALFTGFTLLSGVISRFLKVLIDRPRPTEDLVRIIESAKHQSFPSGHTLFYVIFFGFLIILMNQLKDINRSLRVTISVISALFIFLVPISRVYLGAHWFTDVFGSAMLGILGLATLSYFYLQRK